MFIKSLEITEDEKLVRRIQFHKGLNLIIDETKTTELTESGNSVGKTTVLRLIDYCLGSNGKSIYNDPEFKNKTSTVVESFLKNSNVIISAIFGNDIDSFNNEQVIIRRNFHARSEKLIEINGEKIRSNRFDSELKRLFFNSDVEKPTFRQIISKNIRDEKYRLQNTVKVLHHNTTLEEYEALYFFWFGINTDSASRKQEISEKLKIENNLLNRLKKEKPYSEIEQALVIIERDIQELEEEKNKYSINPNYKSELDELNETKLKLNRLSTELSKLQLRRDLIKESVEGLRANHAAIDTGQIKDIYENAKIFIPELQRKFEELVSFHNNMLESKVKFIGADLTSLDDQIIKVENEIAKLQKLELELSGKVEKIGFIDDIEIILRKLTHKFEQKGSFEEQAKQWSVIQSNITTLETELTGINNGINNIDEQLKSNIQEFNKYFSKLSQTLYDEQFILIPEKQERAYTMYIGSVDGNLGTGKKKGQIAAFDFAYTQFCKSKSIPHLKFILHDQIENMHDNQILNLASLAIDLNIQYIVPILADKIPADMEKDNYSVITLSQDDKLFRIS